MEERIDLVVLERKQRSGGISLAVVISLVLHTVLLILFIRSYRAAKPKAESVPMARYVELIQQNPREHVEAPGPKADQAPLTAPLSDANRRASMPEPSGNQPTQRPGDGGGLYTPPMSTRPRAPQQMANPPQAPQTAGSSASAAQQPLQSIDSDRLVYREPSKAAAATGAVDWKNAIREIGKVASLGGAGLDIGQLGGGEKGFAEAGPLSFETQWYDWGEYAQSMVSRIRVNWYEQMPPLIRTGMKGQVTIRFTILRDGRITNVHIVKSSDIPPYDFAAKKAIELSSPLNPLPKDFPNDSERVTAMFYYNMAVPARNRREGR